MSGIEMKYQELCSVEIQQPYYQNKICQRYAVLPTSDLNIIPTAESISLMEQMGILFRGTPDTGGFTLLIQTTGMLGANAIIKSKPPKGAALTFIIYLNNTSFVNFNEVPVPYNQQKLLFFSNHPVSPSVSPAAPHLTQLPAGVTVPDDLVTVSPITYRFTNAATIASGTPVYLKQASTGIQYDSLVITNGASSAEVSADLRSFAAGKYQLYVGGIFKDEFYYTGALTAKPFAMLELSLSDTLNDNYRLVESNKTIRPSRPRYQIIFTNRSTTWRYRFDLTAGSSLFKAINEDHTVDPTNLKIETNDISIQFASPVFSGAPNTSQIEFLSTTKIALREKPLTAGGLPVRLTLKSGGTTFKEDLPFPDISRLDASDPSNIISDIFLTL